MKEYNFLAGDNFMTKCTSLEQIRVFDHILCYSTEEGVYDFTKDKLHLMNKLNYKSMFKTREIINKLVEFKLIEDLSNAKYKVVKQI